MWNSPGVDSRPFPSEQNIRPCKQSWACIVSNNNKCRVYRALLPEKGLCITHKEDGVPSEDRCSSVQGSLQGAKMFYPSLLKEDRAHYFHNRAPTSITLWIHRCAGHFPTRNSEYATLFSIFVRRICNRYHT